MTPVDASLSGAADKGADHGQFAAVEYDRSHPAAKRQ